MMVRDFQSVIGDEARAQILGAGGRPARRAGRLRGRRLQRHRPLLPVPATTPACAMVGVEAGGRSASPRRARGALPGHGGGARACCTARAPTSCRTRTGRVLPTHSVSAGPRLPGVGPEHAWLQRPGPRRATPPSPTTRRSRRFQLPGRDARGSSRRWSRPTRWRGWCGRPRRSAAQTVLVNLSGRGDKDLGLVTEPTTVCRSESGAPSSLSPGVSGPGGSE